ncbi:hypothetical protein [Modestobacter lacusdianchii]
MRRFVVASNDRVFARLADLGSLWVVTQDVQYLSYRLFAAADEVLVLDRDGLLTTTIDGFGRSTISLTERSP